MTIDHSVNFQGGENTNGSTFRHLFDFNLTFQLDEILSSENAGIIFLDFQTQEGPDGSEDTGDLQAYSNIDENDFTALYELYYELEVIPEVLRLKVGKVDANSEFAYVDFGGDFIHSSPGFSPTIFTLPTYPDSAMSVNLFYTPNDHVYYSFGYYDGSAVEGVKTGRRGPSTFFKSPGDSFHIHELGVKWEFGEALEGRFGVGVWHHTGHFERFDGSIDSETHGYYLVFDQRLYKENPSLVEDAQGIRMFVQVGLADQSLTEIKQHFAVGLHGTGLIDSRDEDVFGVMASYGHLSDDSDAGFRDEYELAIETFYKIQIHEHLAIQPDLQYIINPGGMGAKDALVGTLRIIINF